MLITEATFKRIFIQVNMDYKNHARLGDINITLIRNVDNFDRRYTQPVNATVIHSENIPQGAEVLLHHNASHPTYEIFDYKELSGEFIGSTTRYFSIPESECYAWRLNSTEWQPCEGFEFGLRIFKPYNGFIQGILPTQIKNKLFVTSGELCGKAIMTKGHCDYEVIYQTEKGRDAKLIRFRHYRNEPAHIREEVVCIDHETTNKVESGEYLIGTSANDAKLINILNHA